LRRVKLNIGHLIIWGFTSGIISFLAGSKARNIIPNERGNAELPIDLRPDT
jgi:hypothetical protein